MITTLRNTLLRHLGILLLSIAMMPTVKASEPVKREMRGVWIATIYGLDWPATTGTDNATADAQRQSLCLLLDRMKSAGLNAVMFQVRTFSDAMYRSSLEPWASALTGRRGASPAGNWDPLAFCIDECHKRGIECHAWVNPFRYSTSTKPYTDKFDASLRPMLITYTTRPKNKRERPRTTVILDPGNPRARQHVVDVCRDIVTRYDIDGLIFDDYFYPDRLPLGDGYDYNEWKKSKSPLSQADWRRDNVNRTVKAVSDMLKTVKPDIPFGISPAGVAGGNGVASSRYGLDPCPGNDWMYDRIYCDPLAWMADGLIDYISPQIYWAQDHATNPYGPIALWWSNAATHFGRYFFASHTLSDMTKAKGDTPAAWKERGAQIDINRMHAGNSTPGSIHYAARNIHGFAQYLVDNNYHTPALPPCYDWKESHNPGPVTGLKADGRHLTWEPVNDRCRYAVYAIPRDVDLMEAMSVTYGGLSADYLLGISYTTSYTIPTDKSKGYRYAVAPLDRNGHEWDTVTTD